MAIEFARSERISRGKGGNAVRSAAYALRDKLYDERTGQTHKFKDDGTLLHSEILLPPKSDPKLFDPGTLFNAIEGAERRKDAQVARVVVIALDPQLSPREQVEQANGFARQVFVDKGLPVLVCIHSSLTNPHAHLIGGTRQLGEDGFAQHKVRDAAFARYFGRPLVLGIERMGELWRDFQNNWFSANGKAITVDPVAPVPQEHIGPVRFRAPQDQRIAANEQVRQLNTKIARDPDALLAHVRRQQVHDVGRAAERIAEKHLSDPQERAEITSEIRDKLDDLKREALEKASWADKVPSGLRPLSVEDIARELSPAYAGLVKRASELKEEAASAEWVVNRQSADKAAAEYRLGERWSEMGLVRRGLHLLGGLGLAGLRDTELERWSHLEGTSEYGSWKWSSKRAAVIGELRVVERNAAVELERLRPEAQRILEQQQVRAQNARVALKALHKQENLVIRRSHSRSI